MVYTVTTRYRVGIFLSKAKAAWYRKQFGASFEEFSTLEEAIDELKRREHLWEYQIPWDDFRTNRTYAVMNHRCFWVVYSRFQVGFVHKDDFGAFVSRNFSKHNRVKYRVKGNLSYDDAVRMVFQMGAITGKMTDFGAPNPRYGRLYNRKN